MEPKLTKNFLLCAAIFYLIMFLLGVHMVTVANSDASNHYTCRSERWLKGIGYLLVVVYLILLVLCIYAYSRKQMY